MSRSMPGPNSICPTSFSCSLPHRCDDCPCHRFLALALCGLRSRPVPRHCPNRVDFGRTSVGHARPSGDGDLLRHALETIGVEGNGKRDCSKASRNSRRPSARSKRRGSNWRSVSKGSKVTCSRPIRRSGKRRRNEKALNDNWLRRKRWKPSAVSRAA